MNLEHGRWPEALVAALASLSVGWPLTTLLQEQTWVADGVAMVGLVAVLGAVLRSLGALPSLVALTQLVAGLWALSWLFLAPTLWFGLPTPSSGAMAVDLFAEAGTVLREFAAPAPTTSGVSFLVVSVLLLTAVAVDSIGVTNASPGVAGIPLAAAFLVSVSNNGEPMQPWFFVATASLWMVLVAQQSNRLLSAWPTADRHDFGGPTRFGRGYRTLARMLGVVALACALVMAALLPHMPPTFLGAGLARNAEANNLSGGGEVTFTETMDPAEDLRSRSDTPVVEYTTTAARVQPLRVSAASEFDGQRWLAPSRIGARVQGPDLPAPVGLSPQAVVSSEEVAVSQNRLQAPHLAVPVGTTAVSVSPPTVQVSEDSDAVLLQAPVEEYSATYQEVSADPQPQPVGPSARTIAEQDPRLVRVPEASRAAVTERAEQVLGTRSDPLTVGRQLQGHFRSSGYTYSLELAPQEPDAGEDPISQFLATRQGYCVQFATAMVMMARSEGIPARMAVGFLPGELQDDGVRAVLASDAHTWPELYIDGLGWTRFEPTPGARSGAAPELTQSDVDEAAPEQAPEVPETEPETDSQTGPSAEEPTGREALLGWVGRWGWLLLAGAVVALGLTVLPLVGRWYRRHEARQAQSERDFVESQWLVLTRSLTDLGVPDPGARSPRAMEAHYEDRLGLAPESREALHRLSSTLEQTRYANVLQGEHVTADAVSTDVETVVESVRTSVSRLARARAVLLPRSGRTGVAEWLRARGSRGRTGQSR